MFLEMERRVIVRVVRCRSVRPVFSDIVDKDGRELSNSHSGLKRGMW